jgi:hypothetical protein
MAATGKALVGPLRQHLFGSFPHTVTLTANLPRNTADIRSVACVDHRFACDCREALLAENTAEYRSELQSWYAAASKVLAGHRTWDWSDNNDWRGNGPLACQCHGCQLVRAAGPPVSMCQGDYETGVINPPGGVTW